MFEVQAASLSPLDRIVIGHDDSGSASGWKLEKVGPSIQLSVQSETCYWEQTMQNIKLSQ